MNDRIHLKGIEVYARHGVLDDEKEKAQLFLVDLVVFADLSRAAESDDIGDTIDYRWLATEVRERVGSRSRHLVETVAHEVAETLLGHEGVDRVEVTIHKPEAPLDVVFEDVSVTINRSS